MAKTVLVTGASRGIGKAIATLFAESGYFVAVNYNKSESAAKDLLDSLSHKGCCVMLVQADVSDREQVRQMVENIRQRLGKIDILINNAGVSQQKLFMDITQQEWDSMFEVNLKGVFYCCQSVLPDMISQKRGKIINISSIWGMTGASCEVHYSASKAALIGMTKALAKELGPSNIQVNCIAPGVIETDMNSDLDAAALQELRDQTPLGRIGTAKEIADTALFLATADFITGQVISPNGGFLIV